jgi:hypothetical protein
MKGDDVLRKDMVNGKMVNRKDNFFTNYPAENSKYHQERGNTAAPIPGMLYSPQGNEQSSLPMNGLNLSYNAPTVKPPGPSSRAGTVTITELPPINLKNNGAQSGSTASPDVPNFPTIPAFSDRYGPTGTLAVLEINA